MNYLSYAHMYEEYEFESEENGLPFFAKMPYDEFVTWRKRVEALSEKKE